MSDDAFMSYWEKRNDELCNLGRKLSRKKGEVMV